MSKLLIENKGITQTQSFVNGKTTTNNIKWDANYDGNHADILVNTNTNGNQKSFDVTLSNKDILSLLNIKSERNDLYSRIHKLKKPKQMNSTIKFVEIGSDGLINISPLTTAKSKRKYNKTPHPKKKQKNKTRKTQKTQKTQKRKKTRKNKKY